MTTPQPLQDAIERLTVNIADGEYQSWGQKADIETIIGYVIRCFGDSQNLKKAADLHAAINRFRDRLIIRGNFHPEETATVPELLNSFLHNFKYIDPSHVLGDLSELIEPLITAAQEVEAHKNSLMIYAEAVEQMTARITELETATPPARPYDQ